MVMKPVPGLLAAATAAGAMSAAEGASAAGAWRASKAESRVERKRDPVRLSKQLTWLQIVKT